MGVVIGSCLQSPTLPHLCNCCVAAPPASPFLSSASVCGFQSLAVPRCVAAHVRARRQVYIFLFVAARPPCLSVCVAVNCCIARARRSSSACLAVLCVYLSVSCIVGSLLTARLVLCGLSIPRTFLVAPAVPCSVLYTGSHRISRSRVTDGSFWAWTASLIFFLHVCLPSGVVPARRSLSDFVMVRTDSAEVLRGWGSAWVCLRRCAPTLTTGAGGLRLHFLVSESMVQSRPADEVQFRSIASIGSSGTSRMRILHNMRVAASSERYLTPVLKHLFCFHCNSSLDQLAASHAQAGIQTPEVGHNAEGQGGRYHANTQTRPCLAAAHRPSGTRAANLRATPM